MTDQDIDILNNSTDVTLHQPILNIVNNIGGGSVNIQNEMSDGKALRRLHKAIVNCAGQTINRPDAAVACLPETRKTALAEIHEWKRKQVDSTSRSELMWLTGPAGCGKTSVAESIFEAFGEEGLLIIECFFSYAIGRINPKYLCLTLAYQLATSTISKAVLRPLIENVLLDDPSIVDASVTVQFKRIFLEPIEKAGASIPTIFVVIDGLDECGGADDREQMQKAILSLMLSVISENVLPIRFLVASRPEIWITNTLISTTAPAISKVSLDQDEEADEDIHRFYVSELKMIHNDPELRTTLPPSIAWPSHHDIDTLVENACGQFVYAKTVTRFLGQPHADSPTKRLAAILKHIHLPTTNPLQRLDTLYQLILSYSADPVMLDILGGVSMWPNEGYIKIRREALSILEVLWELEPGTAFRVLRHSHSVIAVPHDPSSERELMDALKYKIMFDDKNQHPRFYHKSFTDFLHDRQRAGNFYVNPDGTHRKLAIGCLRVLQTVRLSPQTRLQAVTWCYARQHWVYHCLKSSYNDNRLLLKALNSFRFVSNYFAYRKIAGYTEVRRKIRLLRLLEKRDGNSEEAIIAMNGILQSIGLNYFSEFWARQMWWWVNRQTDSSPFTFPRLRFTLWYLQNLADEDGNIY